MAETAPNLPIAPEAAPALAFTDVDGAKKWAKALPLLSIGQGYAGLMAQLKALAATTLSPRERATLVEILRDCALHLHTELARRFAGKPQPAAEREQESAEQAIAMWQAFWEQYSLCLKPMLEGDPDLEGVKAKLLQRGLFVGKQLVLVHGLARRLPPPSLWQELHAWYRLAEMLEATVQAVSDDSNPHAVGISCYSTYSHALLLALADPCSMTVRQIEIADRWLAQWARKVFPYAQQRETEGLQVVVDLEGGTGAALVVSPPRSATTCRSSSRSRCCRTSTRTGTSCGAAPRPRRAPSSWSAADCRAPISASAGAPSTARTRSGGSATRTRSTWRRWARSPTTTAIARRRNATGRGSTGRAATSGARPR